jgi:surface antigen
MEPMLRLIVAHYPAGTPSKPLVRKVPAVAAALVLASVAVPLMVVASAGAVTTARICNGWTACSVAPYSTHGYQSHRTTSYWGMSTTGTGDECTNYVAYVESTEYGVPVPAYSLGNANTWAANAKAHKVTVNSTPTVGSVAQWYGSDHDISSDGHVAIVEAVTTANRYIEISQQDISTSINGYDWERISLTQSPTTWEPYPNNFLHFFATPTPTKVAITSAPLVGGASSSANLGPLKIQLEDGSGVNTSASSPTTVDLSTTSPTGQFSAYATGSCTGPAINSVTIPSYWGGSAEVCYGDTRIDTPTLTARTGLYGSATQGAHVHSGPAKGLEATAGDDQGVNVGSTYATALEVAVTDGYANPVADGGIEVDFTAPSTGPTGTFTLSGCLPGSTVHSCSVDTSASGTATAPSLTAGIVSGTMTVSASAPGLLSATFDLSVTTSSTTAGSPGCLSDGTGSQNFRSGYWLAAADGAVFSCGNAPFYGSPATLGMNPASPIVGIASAPDGKGYWLVAADGGIFAFGDARFYGSMGGKPLDAPIVGIAGTTAGGYYEVASDGGMFAFGPGTPFYGSMGGKPLDKPVVGMAVSPAGGYYEVASDGGVFAFGPGTPFYGSMGGKPLNRPVVGLTVTAAGGYYEVASDGGVFSFGPDTWFQGSTGCLTLDQPIVSLVISTNFDAVGTATACTAHPSRLPGGYEFVAADGGVFSFGNATFAGSLGGQNLDDVVGMANPE